MTRPDTDYTTPRDLARELGITQRAVRAYLRERYGKLSEQHATRWELDSAQADDVRRRFVR